MAAPVYSTRFLQLSPSTEDSVEYVVPADQVAVLVDVTCLLDATAGQTFTVVVGSAGCYAFFQTGSTEGVRVESWSGRIVVPAGESITAAVSGTSGGTLVASGYLLSV